ncbi:MAG: Xaa-Pro peptidase family protein [Alicyclobacillus sp.]|nr:Xaa-Pro peptidase family protein [Alicyclobacillus sp.]
MDRFERLKHVMAERGWVGLLATSAPSVQYLTGYTPDLEAGPNPFEPGPVAVFIERDGDPLNGVMIAPAEAADRIKQDWIKHVPYESYNVTDGDYDRRHAYGQSLDRWVESLPKAGVIGVEMHWLPLSISQRLARNVSVVDCGGVLERLRRTKDQDELCALRSAVELANVGQRAVRKLAQPGASEIEVFGEVRTAIEVVAMQRIPLLADFVSGTATANVGGPPGHRVLKRGDVLLADLVPARHGYWGDSCTVTVIGQDPSPSVLKVWEKVHEAMELAKSLIKPGISARHLDFAVRSHLNKSGLEYPHHTGHGLGVQYHEAPVISANSSDILEENMVIAVEPGAYVSEIGVGIRLEHVFRVTKTGCEQWTDYPVDL